MNINILKNTFFFLATRILALYVVVFFVLNPFLNYGRIFQVASIRSLNRLQPPVMNELENIVQDRKHIPRKSLRQFQFYFEKVAEFLPDTPDAQGLNGFSLYYLGKKDKAIRAYERAIDYNPTFFWFYYNLGIIYYKEGDLKKSSEMLKLALAQRPEHVLMFISSSVRFYIPISLLNVPNIDIHIGRQFKKGYLTAKLLLIHLYEEQKMYPFMFEESLLGAQSKIGDEDIFYYYAGVAAYHLKDYQRAGFFLEQAVKINPQFAQAYEYLGLTIKESNKQKLADHLLKVAENLKASITSF